MERKRPNSVEMIGWTIAGAGLGLLSGFVLSNLLGGVDRERIRRAYGSLQKPESAPIPVKAAGGVRAVLAALAADDALATLELEVIAVGVGKVELHGWVPTRGLRARAARIASSVPGIESLVNCILVRGEDEPPADAALDLADQTA
ncbi:MAG: BON domain-containing protein [Gemmatimonadota bacterium]